MTIKCRNQSHRSYKALRPDKPWPQGHATLNVNEWLKYYNVRSSPIDLVAGTSYTINIKPTHHIASPRIKDLAIEKRQCRFQHEKENYYCYSYISIINTEHNHTTIIKKHFNFRKLAACSKYIRRKDAYLNAD